MNRDYEILTKSTKLSTGSFLSAYGKIVHEKGVGACGYYSSIKTEEEKADAKKDAEKDAEKDADEDEVGFK